MADYDAASLAVVGAVSLLYLFVAYRDSAVDFLAPLAAALTICAMAVWHLPNIVLRTDFFPSLVPVVPPELVPFLSVETAFGALFGAGGFLALRRTPRPALWAGLSACAPVVLFTVAYWRIVDFGLNIRWAFVALALAAVSVAAAASVAGERGLRTALGYYAAATVAFISLGMTMTLQEAWLSVALSIQLPALGWIARRVPGRELRWIAGIVAGLVLARLVLNPDVLHYQFGPSPALGWVLYGYGLPALAFWWAARLFRGAGDDALVTMLDAGALAFVVLFLSFEIRAIVAGSLASRHYSLAEQSLHTIAWLSVAYVLRLRDRVARHRVAYWGGRLLVGAAAVQVVGLQLLFSSPLSAHVYWVATGPNSFTPMRLHEAVGAYPVVNLLFLAYAVPAIYFAWFADDFRRQAKPWFAHAFSALSFVLAFAYISLEVRRAFQGPVLGATHTSDAEFYTLSAAWLLYALALLGLGIWLKRSALRYASLVVLLLAILKVFLFDMAGLQGLYRALSFLGLGLCLVAIGYVYQRFVFPRPGRPASAEAPTG